MTKTIIRDFDGPIIDSKKSAFDYYKNNFSWFTDETVKRLFDGNFFEEFKSITWKDFSPDNWSHAVSEYEKLLLWMDIILGVDKIVQGFNTLGYKQYIVTSNMANLSQFLNKYGILDHFSDILDGNKERSKVKKFEMIVKKEWWDISDYFFITDTVGDIKEAIEAWISPGHIFAVTWGYHNRERLAKVEWVKLVDEVEELKDLTFS